MHLFPSGIISLRYVCWVRSHYAPLARQINAVLRWYWWIAYQQDWHKAHHIGVHCTYVLLDFVQAEQDPGKVRGKKPHVAYC